MNIHEFSSPQDFLTANYSHLYGKTGEVHDSPEQTRINLSRRLMNVLKSRSFSHKTILNIGSGPQSLEKQMYPFFGHKPHAELLNQYRFFTLDIADIPSYVMLAKKHIIPHHIRADAMSLPFKSNSIGIVLSNMAIDFIPRTEETSPFSQVADVMDKNSVALFNFHHPSMIPSDLESIPEGARKDYWKHLRDHDLLFASKERIHEHLSMHGLSVQSVYLENELSNTWWNVTAVKAA